MSFQEDIQKEMREQNQRVIEALNEIRPKDIQVTNVKKVPVKWDYTVCDKKTVTQNKLDINKPAIEIEAPDEVIRTIQSISITGDTALLENAKVLVFVDDARVFETKSYGSLQYSNGASIIFDNGFSISPQDKVKIYCFTDGDTEINISAIVRFGEY